MAKIPTLRFHVKYGPAPLFDKARLQLKALAGLNLKIPHALSRFEERGIPLEYLADFQPELWDLVTVETNVRSGRITYMSLQRRLESKRYLWIVLAFEHVITAWIADTNSNRATNPLIVRDGPAWDAAAEGQRPKRTQAVAEWEPVHARQVRARRILVALAHLPECPSSDLLEQAARIVLAGGTWDEAAVNAGWTTREGMDSEIARLLEEVKPSGLAHCCDDYRTSLRGPEPTCAFQLPSTRSRWTLPQATNAVGGREVCWCFVPVSLATRHVPWPAHAGPIR